MSEQSLIDEITRARPALDEECAISRYGDTYTSDEWTALIMDHIDTAYVHGLQDNLTGYRDGLIAVAALTIAAIEFHDKKNVGG